MCDGVAALGNEVTLVVEARGDVNKSQALWLGHGQWSVNHWKVL